MQFYRITPFSTFLAAEYSRYAARIAHLVPDFNWQNAPLGVPSLEEMRQRLAWLQTTQPAVDLATHLRLLRHWTMLRVMQADLLGLANLDEVTAGLTHLAEFSVQSALQHVCSTLAQRYGIPCDESGQPQDLLVIGMGKLGGRELNVSSDIDLIFVYPQGGTTRPSEIYPNVKTLSNHEFFTRVGQRLIPLLSEVTASGFVFRVDMRLRPYGDSGPLVMSFAMLEEYLLSQGREWERYAWIKARTISGAVFMSSDKHAQQCQDLVSLVTPFVYRKYLDFGAIDAIRSLHAQIQTEINKRDIRHSHLRRSETVAPQNNIKLGDGGIRQIEFLAQAFQLIRGGRDSSLRLRPTCAVLKVCVERGLLPAEVVEQLLAAYRLLRQVEHRLQYLEDAQTHTLPNQPALQLALAQSLGFPDCAAFQQVLNQQREIVQTQFATMFGDKFAVQPSTSSDGSNVYPAQCNPIVSERRRHPRPPTWGAGLQQAQASGNLEAEQAQAIQTLFEQFLQSARYRSLPESSQRRCQAVLNNLIDYMLHGSDAPVQDRASDEPVGCALTSPLQTLTRWLNLLENICRRGPYLALLNEYPQALVRVTRMLAAAEWAAQYLTRHPILLAELLDDRSLLQAPDWTQVERQLRVAMARVTADAKHTQQDPTERHLDVLRELHHAQVFRLLAQDLQDQWTPEALSDQLSALADLILRQTLAPCWAVTVARYPNRTPPVPSTPHFAIIAYGKFGGKELGYASDLDLIFLYDDTHPDANEIYAKFAQRLNTWLSSQTSAGILFEIDLRLRPNGNAGLLVSSTTAFSKYQREAAWVWEHQALTRARFCVGDAAIGAWFEAERRAILQLPRMPDTLREEVLRMRQKMLDGHPNPTELFDLKHDRGGMVDIEFTVQYLVLRYAAQQPSLLDNVGNIALLQRAADAGLIAPELAHQAAAVYRHYRRLQHTLRLAGQTQARVAPSSVAESIATVKQLWQQVLG